MFLRFFLPQLNQLMATTVTGLRGVDVLPRVGQVQGTEHAVAQTPLHRLVVNRVTTWEAMKKLKHAS